MSSQIQKSSQIISLNQQILTHSTKKRLHTSLLLQHQQNPLTINNRTEIQNHSRKKQQSQDLISTKSTIQIDCAQDQPICQKKWIQSKPKHQSDPSKMEYYLASGHIQNFQFLTDKLRKKAKQSQLDFYQNNSFESSFNPKCFGIQGQYLILENLLNDVPHPSVVDIKLGRHSPHFKMNPTKQQLQERKMAISSSQKLGFRISGYVTPSAKEHSLLIKDENLIGEILRKVVLTKEHQKQVLDFLLNLRKHLQHHNRIYQATSLLIVSNPEVVRIRWIDFTYWKQSDHSDSNLIQGIVNLYRIVGDLL